MSNITRTKPLIIIIIFLLITNVGMLLFFLFGSRQGDRKSRGHSYSGMYYSLQTEVGFTKDQLGQYQTMRGKQIEKVKPLFNDVRKAKEDFYNLLFVNNTPDSVVQRQADSISIKQRGLDMQMFLYLRSIRGLCTPDQQQKFDSLLTRVVQKMIGRAPKHKK